MRLLFACAGAQMRIQYIEILHNELVYLPYAYHFLIIFNFCKLIFTFLCIYNIIKNT